MKRAILIILLLVFLSAAADELVVPTELCRGLWLVEIEYREGDDGSLVMVFDTGAGPTSVDPDSIERVFGKRVKTGKRVNLKDGTIGPVSLNRIKATVHDMDHLSRALGRDIDGILGFPTFKGLLLTLDYTTNEIRVERGTLPSEDGVEIFRDVGKVRPFLTIEVGDRTLPVLVDSGAAGGLRFREEDPFTWAVEPRPTSAVTGYEKTRVTRSGRATDDLQVGPLVVERPIISVSEGTRYVGAKIMRRSVWTFDQRSRRIRITPDGPEPIRMEPARGSGIAFRPTREGYEVITVFPDTPAAAADVEPGDLLIAVDGVSVDEIDCRPAVSKGADRALLTLRRGESTHDVEIEITDLVP